mgnify:FL=1
MSSPAYLSLVLTGRNDDYGGPFVPRFFRVLAFNLQELTARQIPVEVRLVEWSPTPGRPLLAERLLETLPSQWHELVTTYVVDPRYQDVLSLNPRLRYLEFFAKNVGVRRSTGRFILTTNTDTLLSQRLLDLLAKDTLVPGRVYRANRIDLKLGLDDSGLTHTILDNPENHVPRRPIRPPLYAGAAGDFLLSDSDTFQALRGFNEVYRLARIGIDHNFLVKARSSSVPIEDIGAPVYHISHTTSFQVARNIASPDEATALWGKRDWNQHEVIYHNPENWGLADAPESPLNDRTIRLRFDWRAVPPLTELRRIVRSGATTPPQADAR